MLLDSKLTVYPKKYGLCNIKDNMGSLHNLNHFPRSFDEIDGLKWEAKFKQINYSYDKIKEAICRAYKTDSHTMQNGYNFGLSGTHELLWAFNKFNRNKEEIIKYFKKLNKTKI